MSLENAMKLYSTSHRKFQIHLKNYWKIVYNISLFYLITLSPVSTLTGCTVTIIDIKSRNLQVLCDHEHVTLSSIPKNLKIETRILELSMQNITNLEPNSFEEVIYLKKLIIKSSNLRLVNRLAFKGLVHLESLNLRNNSLELVDSSLPSDCFKYLVNLKYLDLSQNPINYISDFYFKFLSFTLISLTLSDLADDLLLSTHSLGSLNQLEYLDITFNKFKTLRKSSLGHIIHRSYYNSTTVLLAGNLWVCDCRLRWIRDWYYDNLPRITINLIEEIRPGLRTTLRPICHNPVNMQHKYLFPPRFSTLSIQEMRCEERALTNNTYIKAQENSNVTFHCTFIVNVENDHQNRIKWFKNGFEVNPLKNMKYFSKSKIDNFKLFTIFKIYRVKLNDQGKWECRLTSEENFMKSSTVFQLFVKSDELIMLSNKSKKLLIYISVSLLTFLLIIFVIGTSFYFCFQYHKSHSNLLIMRKTNPSSNSKDIRPKSVTINPQGNHLLLYDDCDMNEDKIINQYEPYSSSFVGPCACKDCSATIKKCMHFSGLSIESDVDISVENNDDKSFSPCPVHGDCNLSITEIVPNIEPKKSCPIHGLYLSKHIPEICTEIHPKGGTLKAQSSKKTVIVSGKPRNDILLSTISKNKNIYLNCPLHGKIMSLNQT